ncbi:hypothetical protein HHK36_002893 [Tetracentron sinense]|uniref:Uncharacterized protein n=1 Tax=Tetracentron sinense TaxID=13715 RepID=A0A834ZRT3_TETSI|nr:hypothetical protein HHK36_002893 [Tetracentron sinense]
MAYAEKALEPWLNPNLIAQLLGKDMFSSPLFDSDRGTDQITIYKRTRIIRVSSCLIDANTSTPMMVSTMRDCEGEPGSSKRLGKTSIEQNVSPSEVMKFTGKQVYDL